MADPTDAFRLDGAVVLLTGATGGLGGRMAQTLSDAGARLLLTGRDTQRLSEVAARCPGSVEIPCDLADRGQVETLVERALAPAGHIDVVVNNAGAAYSKPALDEDMDEVRDVLELDVVAPFRIARDAARAMVEQGIRGSIVNVGSITGIRGTGRLPMGGYAAAKSSITGLTQELAAQWGRYGIRVNVLAPGWMAAGMGAWTLEDEKGRDWIERRTPLRRLGTAEDLDGALLFLASGASAFVTGQCIAVDGGWTAT